MKLQFQKKELACLRSPLTQVQNLEQTQEVRLPEGMSGISRILGAWGQVILRSKEWQGDSVRLTGGVMTWVLYEPEEGGSLQQLETWIPFRMDWDLPGDFPEGKVRLQPLLRYVDARSVSAGKVMVRVGIGVLAECWCPHIAQVCQPQEDTVDVELLRSTWPVRLPREAGEKTFELEEELTLPPSAPQPERLVYFSMDPAVADRKVLANRLVFRGNGNLHLMYLSEEGQLHSWDFELPFSQYTELETGYSSDAQGDVQMALIRLELEIDGEGKLHLKAGLTGQYLVDDREMLETVEDAYSPQRELEVKREVLELPVLLDRRRENIYGEQTISAGADIPVDVRMLSDFPRQNREGDAVVLEQPAMAQILYYDAEGHVQSSAQRLEGSLRVPADMGTVLSARPMGVQPQVIPGADSMTIRAEMPVQIVSTAGQGIPMVTELELGDRKTSDPGRPSLILRRAEDSRLWDIARHHGSTVAAIREANGFTGEPEAGRMLLIPVL